jgi:hypothetical protein
MNTKKQKIYTLVNTDVTKYTYQDYLDFCECNEIEPQMEDSNDFWEWCSEQADFDLECEKENMNVGKIGNRDFLISGHLGLWNGKPQIKYVVVHGLVNAIEKCWRGCDDGDAKLNTESGVIEVHGYHHDGTNCFELRLLNKNGEKWAENAENRYEDIEFNNRWWTKIKDIREVF